MNYIPWIGLGVILSIILGLAIFAPVGPEKVQPFTSPCDGHYGGEHTYIDGYRVTVLRVLFNGMALVDVGGMTPAEVSCSRLGS